MILEDYAERDRILREMGYPTYGDYLRSQTWHDIRDAAFKRSGGKCQKCNRQANNVHHKDYSRATLEGKTLDKLIALCHWCHSTAEFLSNGRKRSLKEVNECLSGCVSYETAKKKLKRPKPPRVTTADRQKICEDLGFHSFADYLESHLFRKVKRAAGSKCQMCGEPAKAVEFLDYRKGTLMGLIRSSIVALCWQCFCAKATEACVHSLRQEKGDLP